MSSPCQLGDGVLERRQEVACLGEAGVDVLGSGDVSSYVKTAFVKIVLVHRLCSSAPGSAPLPRLGSRYHPITVSRRHSPAPAASDKPHLQLGDVTADVE
jgi:hypothetical protein